MNMQSGPPISMPMIVQASRGNSDEQPVPARIRVAMAVLSQLTHKTATEAAPHGMGCETIPGQELTLPERRTQDAACSILIQYLRGDLKHDEWDELHHYTTLQGVWAQSGGARGIVICCPVCEQGQVSKSRPCPVCSGTGALITLPARPRTHQDADPESDPPPSEPAAPPVEDTP